MKPSDLTKCTVCESHNLNVFDADAAGGHFPIWWCEDCGTLHKGSNCGDPIAVWQPEKSMLHHQVLAFHKRFGQSVGERPHVPDEKTLRFRLSLVVEEVLELLEAAGYYLEATERGAVEADALSRRSIGVRGPLRVNGKKVDDGKWFYQDVDLPALVDALADIDYVIEGFRITLGVNGKPIADEVQRANMAKLPSYVVAKDAAHGKEVCQGDRAESGKRCPDCDMYHPFNEETGKVIPPLGELVKRADGKILKPEGWKPPDIEGELKKQRWEP